MKILDLAPEVNAATAAQTSLYGAMSNTLGAMVDSIEAVDRMINSLQARKLELVDQARQWSEVTQTSSGVSNDRGWTPGVRARRELVAELACVLRIPEPTAETMVATSKALVHELPATLASLSEGRVSLRHAEKLVDESRTVPADALPAFEAAVLPAAECLTVAKFTQKARRLRERLHPETIEARHERALKDRDVVVLPEHDGMASLLVTGSAPLIHAAHHRLNDMAERDRREQGRDSTDDRTIAQRRTDLLLELLIEGQPGDGSVRNIVATLAITVPVLRLLGASDQPATLEGYGPIDIDTALTLAGTAKSFVRVLTDPVTGSVKDVDRECRMPPADLRRWLVIDDETCRFPNCNRPASRSDIDHTNDWFYGGRTAVDNLAHLCLKHHRFKHHTAWTVEQLAGRILRWTSPSGRVYLTYPTSVARYCRDARPRS
ncbi:hypothetical protein HDC94_001610 [Leifsonia sp. AK011]|uniref:HNH endonuclease signature motif containing protein n=1 Tax=Leifsonia sp. AK011 TaxID=2723075 RepID=UPI0015CAE3FF|nr:HNH endonuclease signature motif containing protein [Leifsonia sp. AK011]NYF10454.1 hypothetical protein [Leifsonia sp. AK011]